MFLPDNCDFRLSIPINEPVQYIAGNREKSIFVVATHSTLYVYLANPLLLVCSYKRESEEIAERGEYRKVYWRHDSSSICVTTSKHCIYIYSVETKEDTDVFNLHDPYNDDYGRISQEFFIKQKRPKISLYLSVVAKLESYSTCVASLKDELFVCLRDGWIHRLSWTGEVLQEFSFNIRNVPFSTDQLHAKSTKMTGLSVYVADIVYCPLIGGLCCVLSDGRAGLLVSTSHRFQPQSVTAVWALGMKDAVCCAANHKFRLIYFGCQNGEIAAYHLDDANGSLVQTYRVGLSIKNSREYLAKLGPVHQIQCLSQGYAFSVIWKLKDVASSLYQNGSMSSNNLEALEKQPEVLANPPPVVAIFSPFGIQWWCSLEDASERPASRDISFNCIEWGPEGFQLWSGSDEGVTLTHLVRSIYINQPSAEYHDRVIMVGADKVMVSPQRKLEKLATAPYCVWNTFRAPYEYISLNWPIRFVGVDEECSRIVAIAGNRGFAYYNIKSAKWKLFRNEAQEQALLVTGGIAVFKDFIVATGADLDNDQENVFIYSTNQQLEANSATKFQVGQRIMMMNLRDDHMLTFDIAATICIFILKQVSPNECHIDRCAEIRINELLPHPTCVISTQLTSLSYHSEASYFCHEMDSLLVNVSGHLLLLSPFNKDRDREGSESDDDSHFQLHQPMLIASQVERVWLQPGHRDIPHLNKAVWINSGIKKMKVWLPLFHSGDMANSSQSSTKNFIAKRIMLPIELNVYPIAIDEDCLACGVESLPHSTTSRSEELVPILVHSVTRNNEVFIHRLLRQLLKRNLGIYALEIASTCRPLPYFGHILELLLHDVLDEEATSSEPIPDPLLPRVVAFIHEFPEYLQTIVHCARKTELAFWTLLFSVSHHPRELFKMCLKEDQLDTATSCLIILQSMESTVASVQHATKLLEEALNKRRWLIARDIVRFLNSINEGELDEVPESPLYQKLAPKGHKPLHALSDSASDDYNLVFNSISVETHATRAQHKQSISQQSSYGPNTPGVLEKHRDSISPLASSANADLVGVSIPRHMQKILERHAGVLLEDYSLRDLGAFASHLDFDLVQFFTKSDGGFAYSPDQFPIILMKLHSQFKWPYPVVGDVIDRLISKFQQADMTPSASEDEIVIDWKKSQVNERIPKPRRNRTYSKPTFEWRVFEKLCAKSQNKNMQSNESELTYMLEWLSKAHAIEWIYMISLMYRDLSVLYNLLKDFSNQQRINIFLNKVTLGTEKLLDWAIDSCPAYVSIVQLFMNFLDQLKDMQRFRKISNSTSPEGIIQRPNGLLVNGTTVNGTSHAQN